MNKFIMDQEGHLTLNPEYSEQPKPIVLKVPPNFDFEKFKKEWYEAVSCGDYHVIRVSSFNDVTIKEDGE
jgi:hypothetical protein